MPTCHKCRCAATVTAADGLPYCAYCSQYAPKPFQHPKEEDES